MRWPRDRELRAADEFAMRFVDELGGRFEAFRLSRSENQERFGILPLQCSKRDESEGFLCGDHAACDDDWRAAATPSLRFQPIRERCGRGKLQIVFQVTADKNAIRRRPENADALGILFTLHEEAAGVRKSIFQKGPQEKTERAEIALVTREGSVRDASAYEEYGNLSAAGLAQKVRPDFGLENQNERGPHRVHGPPNAKGPVERKVDDRVGKGHSFECKRLTCDGRRGNNERPGWVGFFQAPGERHAGKRLTDGNRVKPDGSGLVRMQVCERRK